MNDTNTTAPAQVPDAKKQDHLPAWSDDEARVWTGEDDAPAWKQEG